MKANYYLAYLFVLPFILCGCERNELPNPASADEALSEQLMTRSGAGVLAEPTGYIYFKQDFNSSTDYNDYIGDGQHLFDNMATNNDEYATINTLNNTLQIVKKGDGVTGIHRASVTRMTKMEGSPANFLRFSLDVTISENTKAIDNGFLFAVGRITSDAPVAPGAAQIHSMLRINPTENTGEFTILTSQAAADQKISAPLSGTQTIVWYVNATGAPVGYTAPDGLPGSVQADMADVWVVNAEGAMLAVDEAPAVSPQLPLEGFKIANNPNFTATLDIDNMVLSEEATIEVPVIVSVAEPPVVSAPLKTDFELAPLPAELAVTYADGSTEMVEIAWEPGPDGYNKYILGTYNAVGTIVPKRGTINPDNISVETTLTVRENINIVDAFSPNNDGKNDVWINPELRFYRTVSVEVFDRDGVRLFHTTDPTEGWDGKNQYGKVVPGSYFYVIKLPDLILEKKGVLTLVN